MTATILAALLISASAVLICWHVQSWRRARSEDLDEDEHHYRRRQFRRRVQASAMMGLIGVLILAGALVPRDRAPNAFVGIWFVVMLLVLWIALLAVGDIASTRAFFQHARRAGLAEQVRLHSELRRLRDARATRQPRSNGRQELDGG